MFKKIHFLFVFAFALPAASYAKGPWDNGDYSQFIDESGIYQASMRFKNGSGFSQWGTNVSLTDAASASGTSASSTASIKIGSPLNRSVIYYKGIIFVGNATGMVDHVRKSVMGITNSFTNLTSSNSASSGGSSVTATSVIVNNGAVGLTANSVFNAKINQTAPILKFNGTGQLSVVNGGTFTGGTATAITNLDDVVTEIVSMRVVGSRIFMSSIR